MSSVEYESDSRNEKVNVLTSDASTAATPGERLRDAFAAVTAALRQPEVQHFNTNIQ